MTEELKGLQNDSSMLPTLQISDISPLIERFEYEERIIKGCRVLFTD
jgi:hypothetical protein